MTTLRRVLQQSAREADPTLLSPSSKPITPHPAKPSTATPKRSIHEPEENEEDLDSANYEASGEKQSGKKMTKRRRSSRTWEEAAKETTATLASTASSSSSSSVASKVEELKSPKQQKLSSTVTPKQNGVQVQGSSKTNSTSPKENGLQLPPNLPTPSSLHLPSSIHSINSSPKEKPSINSSPKEKQFSASVVTIPPPPPRTPSPPQQSNSNTAQLPVTSSTSTSTATIITTTAPIEKAQANSSTDTKKGKGKAVVAPIPQQLEWVQCERCKKWRKLPLNVPASSLPDEWFCEMNTWNPASATCTAVEDVADETTGDDGTATDANQVPVAPRAQRQSSYLPQGINFYGSVSSNLQAAGPNGSKRVMSYRDLIASHYRNHKTFNPLFDRVCDSRYKLFSAYTSPTLKQRACEKPTGFCTWTQSLSVISTKHVLNSSSTSDHQTPVSTPTPLTPALLPPKKKFKALNNIC